MNEVVEFIKQQRTAGQTDEQIKNTLKIGGGWTDDELNKAFLLPISESTPSRTIGLTTVITKKIRIAVVIVLLIFPVWFVYSRLIRFDLFLEYPSSVLGCQLTFPGSYLAAQAGSDAAKYFLDTCSLYGAGYPKHNLNVCNSLQTQDKIDCLADTAYFQSTDHPRFKIDLYTSETMDVKTCTSAPSAAEKDRCTTTVAVNTKNSALCGDIQSSEYKGVCEFLVNVRLSVADPKVCTQIGNIDLQQRCTCLAINNVEYYYGSSPEQCIVASKNKNYVVLNAVYTKDAVSAFFMDDPIEGADPTSFSALSFIFAKDKNSVYFGKEKLMGVDQSSFKALLGYYGKDMKQVFYMHKPLDGAEIETFEALTSRYAKDKLHAYFDGKQINGVDSATFKTLNEFFASDNNRVYFEGKIISSANPGTFSVIPEEGFNGQSHYGKDVGHVWYETNLTNADPESFKVGYDGRNGEDKDRQYLFGQPSTPKHLEI